MKNKKYRLVDLNVHPYGHGSYKRFIVFTDFNKTLHKWETKVYPDIEGNKANATRQALRWLNSEDQSRYHIFHTPSKIPLQYDGPQTYAETDNKGNLLI